MEKKRFGLKFMRIVDEKSLNSRPHKENLIVNWKFYVDIVVVVVVIFAT